MKKTLTINISGIIFHIDEDAFNKLSRYLENIKAHFRSFEGRDEVIADIESRIAEILQPKVTDSNQVITIEDIEEVIKIMGQPSEFEVGDEDESDPTSAVPPYTYGRTKRLYRDPENKMLGGVCAGLGAYFNIDTVWIRLIFILITLSGGFGVALYLILWIVVPEAWTTTERLEMRGQPINISNIESSVKREVDHLKDKINEMADRTRDTYNRKRTDFRRSQDPVVNALNSLGRVLGKIVVVFIGIILLLIGISLSTAVLAALLGMPGIAFFHQTNPDFIPFYNFMNLLYDNPSEIKVFWLGAIIVIGIPVLMLLVASFRLIFGFRSARWINAIALYIWIAGIVVTLIFGIKLARSFRYSEDNIVQKALVYPRGDTLDVKLNRLLNGNNIYDLNDVYNIEDFRFGFRGEDRTFYGIPEFSIHKSTDENVNLSVYYYAKGESRMSADSHVDHIIYNYMFEGNRLTLDDSFTIAEGEPWRRQRVEIDLSLPEGTVFHLDSGIYRILEGHYDIPKYKMSGKTLIMTRDGIQMAGESENQQTSSVIRGTISQKLLPISIVL